MTLKYTTPVANEFFDKRMAELSSSAIRVYLKIVRNTWGWRNENGQVKNRDWISHSQFGRVGVSSRSVTKAIEELLKMGLIRITDDDGNNLSNPTKRKFAKRIYYSPIAPSQANSTHNKEKNAPYKAKRNTKPTQEVPATKENYTKGNEPIFSQGAERLTDRQRLNQIKEEQQRKQIQRDSWLEN